MQNYVVDTNFFFNLQIKSGFGSNPKEIIMAVTNIGNHLKKAKKAEFFMPPLILDEFLTFFTDQNENYVQDFLAFMAIKAPDYSKIEFSAKVFYELVKEMRHRSYRGLQVGEEILMETGKSMMDRGELDKIAYQKTI